MMRSQHVHGSLGLVEITGNKRCHEHSGFIIRRRKSHQCVQLDSNLHPINTFNSTSFDQEFLAIEPTGTSDETAPPPIETSTLE
jgi:hypothetical protein